MKPTYLCTLMLCALPFAAPAAELTINPGLWETTMTRTDPMTGQPVTETRSECVTDTKFNPGRMMQGTEGCELTEDELKGDTLTFSMRCSMQGSEAVIDGLYQADDHSGKGNMDMTINAGGMNMKMNMNWTAKRIGDC